MELSKKGKYLFAIGSVLITVLALAIYINLLNREEVLLFSDQSSQTLASISNSLKESGIEFDYPPSGVNGLMVSAKDVNKIKIQLTNDNVFKPNVVGFELFNESHPSMSELHQKVNYQRALQGELEKSILLINGVESARVHLAIPREKTFSRSKLQAKAAVTLSLTSIGRNNISIVMHSVRTLVSGSVSGLLPENVSILDSNGELLSSHNEQSAVVLNSRKEHLEEQINKKIIALLSSHFLPEDIGVSSWVVLNNDKVSETSQGIDDRSKPIVTQRKTEVKNGKKKSSSTKITDEQFGYREVTRSVDYAEGGIQKVTVSLIVPISAHFSVETLRELVTSALSLDYSRGDLLTIVAAEKQHFELEPILDTVTSSVDDKAAEVKQSPNMWWNGTFNAEFLALISLLLLLSILLIVQSLRLKRLGKLTKKEEGIVLEGLDNWLEEKCIERQ
ncbi:hypothetical protein F7Q91_22560 [Vibrio chagasii]|uniref:Flagellar M-ring protein n=1 Tax=Vibrio chagasii TaxID=170679 RepID=A0A7V7NPY5_9VIBR|nr:flagellar M-ring protein FliF C-terminal domain-containing protein [Vibrio chagasii]KAB0470278.1 hypothetical protein F7Q91_22560 [Vibrio chagasii]